MTRIPEKLKHDAIIEALVELRFEHAEAMSEVVVTRFLDRAEWTHFQRKRLPLFDVPQQIRFADHNLRVQPLIELINPDQIQIIKFGSNVISLHNLHTYVGWNATLKNEVFDLVDFMFQRVHGLDIRRIGLRYINAFTQETHHIVSPHDLNIDVKWQGATLAHPFNLNYIIREDDFDTTMRIATKELVTGKIPDDMTAYVDVDVATHSDFSSSSSDNVKSIIDRAHTREKLHFFGLLSDERIDELEEKT